MVLMKMDCPTPTCSDWLADTVELTSAVLESGSFLMCKSANEGVGASAVGVGAVCVCGIGIV
jgi:hypothetical protein